MSASWPGSMRGPRVKTPLLLLLLLLLSTVTRTALCQTEEPELEKEIELTDPASDPDNATTPSGEESDEIQETSGSGQDRSNINASTSQPIEDTASEPTDTQETENPLNPFIILIPVVLVALIISIIVCCIFINRRWNTQVKTQELQKEDPYLDGSSTEKVPMPMFEEDVPSVLELEMEELDKWMKKDG